jgi:hypothetical protein
MFGGEPEFLYICLNTYFLVFPVQIGYNAFTLLTFEIGQDDIARFKF